MLAAFLSSDNCEEISNAFTSLIKTHNVTLDDSKFYTKLKRKLTHKSDEIKLLYSSLDDKKLSYASRRNRTRGNLTKKKNDVDMRVLVVGATLSGLRMAVEASLLGCRATVCLGSFSSSSSTSSHEGKKEDEERSRLLRYHLSPWTVDEVASLGGRKEDMLGQNFFQSTRSKLRAAFLRACLLLGVNVSLSTQYLASTKQSHTTYTAQLRTTTTPTTPTPTRHRIDPSFEVLIDACDLSLEGSTVVSKECGFVRSPATANSSIATTLYVSRSSASSSSSSSNSEVDDFSWTRKTNPCLFARLDQQSLGGLHCVRYLSNNESHHCYMESESSISDIQIHKILTFFGLSFMMYKKKEDYSTTKKETMTIQRKNIRRWTCKSAMKIMGESKRGKGGGRGRGGGRGGGGSDGCLVMLCGGSLSEEHAGSGSYLHLEWLGVLDNGAVLESIRNVSDDG